MSNEQKLRDAIKRLLKAHRITVQAPPKTITEAENQLRQIENAVKYAEEALATTEPGPTGMPPSPEPDIHYIYIGLGWKPATAQQYAETHRQKCAMHSTIQLQTYGEQCWKAGYKHGAFSK